MFVFFEILLVCHFFDFCRDTHDSNVSSRVMYHIQHRNLDIFREKATMIILERNTSTTGTFSSGSLGATHGSGVAIPSVLVAQPIETDTTNEL
jgi:hypothetical protein